MRTRFLSAVSLLAASAVCGWADSADAQLPLPMDQHINSGIRGEMPTSVRSGGSNARAAVFYNSSAGETWAWEPASGLDYSLGNSKSICDGGYWDVACSEDIEVLSSLGGTWTTVSHGLYPSLNEYALVWEDHKAASDVSIGWLHPSGYISHYLANNGRNEERPVLSGFEKVAYQVFNGSSYDVEVFDRTAGYVTLVMPDHGDEMHPDAMYWKYAWEGSGYAGGIGWMDWAGVDHDVPVPGTCAGYQRPRLGYFGDWVVYEGYGCPNGGSELFLADMTCGDVYYVDEVQPLIDLPSYTIEEDQLFYVNGSGEVVYVDVDEKAFCGGSPGAPVPTIFRAPSGQKARDVAVSLMQHPQGVVIFSDGSDVWHWEPHTGAPFPTTSGDFTSLDSLELYSTAEHDYEIYSYDSWAHTWNVVGKGTNPTIFNDTITWEDPWAASDGAISGAVGGGWYNTVLDGNGLDEKNPVQHGSNFAYEVDVGGDWDIGIHDFFADSHIDWVPSKGDERNPDLWDSFVAFDLDSKYIVRYEFGGGSYDVAPVPPGCSYLTRPLLGGDEKHVRVGEWVLFAALDCSGPRRGNELWLYSFASGQLYFVDRIGALNNHAYHMILDRIVYVDLNGEVVYLELDGSAI